MKFSGAVPGGSALLLAFLFSPVTGSAQASSAACLQAPAVLASNAPNIFNEKQEQDLGDALAELVESEVRIARPGPDDQLTRIGQKLLAQLPLTGTTYSFRAYDSGEVNGFSIAGGRVYISRKLIAAVKNEDQLAGVLAHEIGHLYTHQVAIEMTKMMRVRLGVTSVGDRQDIFAKVHQLMSAPAKSGEGGEKEEKHQLVADQIAFYAMVQAGYSPETFSQFLNDSMVNKGKTGNRLSDMFGLTSEASQRYRSALKMIADLPAGCRNRAPHNDDAFAHWRTRVMEERVDMAGGTADGDKPVTLDPPLRPNLWRVKFSPDGKLVLAQDETGLAVVEYATQKVLFRIAAPDAEAAQFTPDGKEIVFHDANLRVERWDATNGKREQVKEMVVFEGCNQTMLSQDGRTLVCLNLRERGNALKVDLRLLDVETGGTLLERKDFFGTDQVYGELAYWQEVQSLLSGNLALLETSPDGRYLLVQKWGKLVTYDFTTRQPVNLSGKLKDLGQHRFTFLGSDQVFVVGDVKDKMFKASTISFPEGRVTGENVIGMVGMWPVTKGKFLKIGPLKDYPIGIYDPSTKNILAAWKGTAIDVWDTQFAGENATGTLALSPLSGKVQNVALPLGALPHGRAAAFSKDGKYLVFSLRSRAAIWNVETGKQEKLVRPMRSAWFDEKDRLFSQDPKFQDYEAEEVEVDWNPYSPKVLSKYDEKVFQRRDLDVEFKPMGKEKDTDRHVTMQVKKMGATAVLWSRDFPKDRPVVWPAEGEMMLLGWDLQSDTAKTEVKSNARLQQEAGSFSIAKKGLLLESVNATTGKMVSQVVLPEIDLTHGWNDERFARLSGEYVVAEGEHGNTAIYRMDTGKKAGEFFGVPVASDAECGLIAAVNRESEMLIVDEKTGKELQRFTLGSPVLAARIAGDKEKRLMVLTADQVVHRLPLPEGGTAAGIVVANAGR
jgi:WD40 repeat protein